MIPQRIMPVRSELRMLSGKGWQRNPQGAANPAGQQGDKRGLSPFTQTRMHKELRETSESSLAGMQPAPQALLHHSMNHGFGESLIKPILPT